MMLQRAGASFDTFLRYKYVDIKIYGDHSSQNDLGNRMGKKMQDKPAIRRRANYKIKNRPLDHAFLIG